METKKILDAATGTGASAGYFVDTHSPLGSDVFIFVSLNGGSAVIESSADNINFVPVEDGALAASGVKWVDPSVGSYLRVAYTGVTSITAFIQPKYESNG